MSGILKRRVLWLLIPALALALLVFLGQQPPAAEWLGAPPPARKPRLAFLSGWTAPVRTQWQRLKLRFLGPPVSVSLSCVLFETTNGFALGEIRSAQLVLSNRGPAQAWLVDTGDLARVKRLMERSGSIIAAPGIWARDGMPAVVSVGGGGAGVSGIQVNVVPRVHGREIDLAAFLSVGRIPGETNAAVGARWRMKDRQGVVLLAPDTGLTNRVIGLMLAPVIQSSRR